MTTKHNHKQWKKLNSDESHWCPDKQELTIDLTSLLGEAVSLILIGWKQGIIWKNNIDGEIEQHKNPFEESLFPISFIDHDILKPWRESIPEAVIKRLKTYKGNAFGMLNICSCYQCADELFSNNPILFWLLFGYAQKNNWHEFQFVKTCRLKQTEILKAIKLPAKKSTLKLLQKIKARQYSKRENELIRQLLSLEFERLNHRDTISIALIELIFHFPQLLNSKLLNQLNGKETKLLREFIQDTEHMARRIGLDSESIDHQLYRCKNLNQVERLHDKLVEQFNKTMEEITGRGRERRKTAELLLQPFPIPPLLGDNNIVPITSRKALIEEGKQQGHCVAVYDEDIIRGRYYVYQVIAPERATLGISIKKKQDNSQQPSLSIEQLKGYHNKTVNQATKEAVLLWFNDKNNINQKVSFSLPHSSSSTKAKQQTMNQAGSE